MNGGCRVLVLGVLSWLVCSCYSTYTGIYFLERSQEVTRTQAEEIARDLRGKLLALGFTEGDPLVDSTGGVIGAHFYKRRGPSSSEVRNLSGSNAHISVAIGLEGPFITIRDYSNNVETDYMRALKSSIERVLEDKDISGARFERQMELFNS